MQISSGQWADPCQGNGGGEQRGAWTATSVWGGSIGHWAGWRRWRWILRSPYGDFILIQTCMILTLHSALHHQDRPIDRQIEWKGPIKAKGGPREPRGGNPTPNELDKATRTSMHTQHATFFEELRLLREKRLLPWVVVMTRDTTLEVGNKIGGML